MRSPRHIAPFARIARSRALAAVAVAAVASLTVGAVDGASSAQAASFGVVAKAVRNQTTPASTIKGGAITTSTASTVAFLVAADGPARRSQTITSVTGCGLSWSLARRANGTSGTSEAWVATAAGPLTSCAPTGKLKVGRYIGAGAVYAVSGSVVAASSGSSAWTGSAATTVPAQQGDLLLGVGND
jgi:hypothetical protein